MGFVHNVNQRFERSWLGNYFDVANRGSTLSIEIRSGLVCFLVRAVTPAGQGRGGNAGRLAGWRGVNICWGAPAWRGVMVAFRLSLGQAWWRSMPHADDWGSQLLIST
jgi:hypothetical protein